MIEKLNSDELLAMSTAHLYLIFVFFLINHLYLIFGATEFDL